MRERPEVAGRNGNGAAAAEPAPEWARLEAAEAARRLASDLNRGLEEAEAAARIGRFGANVLAEQVSRPPWRILVDQFRSALVGVLLAAALVSASCTTVSKMARACISVMSG